MKIKSNFIDVYDHSMTALVGYTDDVVYSRYKTDESISVDELNNQSETFKATFLNYLLQNSPNGAIQISKDGEPFYYSYGKQIHCPLMYKNGKLIKFPKNFNNYWAYRIGAIAILGTDVYFQERLEVSGLDDLCYNQRKPIAVTSRYLGNMIDKNVCLPKFLEHKPLAIIKLGDKLTLNFNKAKTYNIISNFSIAADERWFLELSEYTTDNNADLLKIYSSIEQRLLWEREQFSSMVEINNDDKIKKAGFNETSFKKVKRG